MTEATQAVTVKILDKEYKVGCPTGEHGSLIASAKEVDARMRVIRQSGKVLSSDRIAVMVALNLAHELVNTKIQVENIDDDVFERLENLQEQITNTLKRCGNE
ncbi:MAG: Z-ring-associated protein ZapA [uncultured Thiotrichaceae bacterium]|uniref:Cell division protein ZapA n=1 Tax=uncultured Thiotrichaceae bacterium TaxID=298394 RepID=A0A6S6S0N1_9GAMM|nr:MAG: Z-ring-associated protein ZapA [uncultured Thiotrichaceae bacterium]